MAGDLEQRVGGGGDEAVSWHSPVNGLVHHSGKARALTNGFGLNFESETMRALYRWLQVMIRHQQYGLGRTCVEFRMAKPRR